MLLASLSISAMSVAVTRKSGSDSSSACNSIGRGDDSRQGCHALLSTTVTASRIIVAATSDAENFSRGQGTRGVDSESLRGTVSRTDFGNWVQPIKTIKHCLLT